MTMIHERVPTPDGGSLSARLHTPGHAPPTGLCLIYIHGFGSVQEGAKSMHFRDRALDSGHAFCTFDLRGHGESTGDTLGLTLSRCLEDLAAVLSWLREHGQTRIVPVGYSMGAITAMWYSVKNPERFEAAVLLAPALVMRRGLLLWAGKERAAKWQRTGAIHFQNEWFDCMLGWHLIEDLRAHDRHDLARRYRTPTLFLQGMKDPLVPWRETLKFVSECPFDALELHLIKNGEHRLTQERELVWDLADGLLRRLA